MGGNQTLKRSCQILRLASHHMFHRTKKYATEKPDWVSFSWIATQVYKNWFICMIHLVVSRKSVNLLSRTEIRSLEVGKQKSHVTKKRTIYSTLFGDMSLYRDSQVFTNGPVRAAVFFLVKMSFYRDSQVFTNGPVSADVSFDSKVL